MRLSWGDYTGKIVSIILAQPAGATSISGSYNYAESIKPAAYLRPRSNIKCNIKPTDLFPTTHSFFFAILATKYVLKTQLSYPSVRSWFTQQGEGCVSLSTGDNKDNLSFSRGEADSIMLSLFAAVRSFGHSDPIVILQMCTIKLQHFQIIFQCEQLFM